MNEDFLTQLRRVNAERAIEWMNGKEPDVLFWATEFGGEVGEVLNEVKKLRREELGWRGSRTTVDKLADEMGDVLICLDSLARYYGIDLSTAVANKFNKTSDNQGFSHKLVAEKSI
jgi:NTP pyrophosphatase (non-canonical NTP hydrolase)